MQGKHYIPIGERCKEEIKQFDLQIKQGPLKAGKYTAIFSLRESPQGLYFGEPIKLEFKCHEPLSNIDEMTQNSHL